VLFVSIWLVDILYVKLQILISIELIDRSKMVQSFFMFGVFKIVLAVVF